MNKRAAALAVLVGLSACGSSPRTHFFALSPLTSPPQRRIGAMDPVQVAAVHLPPMLDRREMVAIADDASVTISSRDRWSAPLDRMTRRVLSQDLAAQLRPGAVIAPDAPAPPETAKVVVTVAQFGPAPEGKTVLDAQWTLLQGAPTEPGPAHTVALSESGSTAGGAMANAMSKLVAQLASQIAGDLPQAAQAHGAPALAFPRKPT